MLTRILGILGWLGTALVLAAVPIRLLRPDLETWWWSLAVAGLACVLVYMLGQWREIAAAFSRRQARYGTLSVASILIVLGIVVALNYVATRRHKRWDLTANQQFTLSEQTTKILDGLKNDVRIRVFARDEEFGRFRDRLDEYDYVSPRVSVEYIDVDRQPALANQYEIQTSGTIVVEYQGRIERTTSDTEQDITNAILKAVQGEQKKVYFVQGHGERDPTSADERSGFNAVADMLKRENYQVESLVLAQQSEVPADASVVVVAGPTTDYLQGEIDALNRYLRKGGKLLLMLDPTVREDAQPLDRLVAFAREWGFDVGNNVVLDPVGQMLGMGADAPVAASFPSHPITNGFGRLITAFPLARSVTAVEGGVNGRTPQPIVETSPRSFAKVNMAALREGGAIEMNEAQGDKPGPISLAAALGMTAPETPPSPKPASTQQENKSSPVETRIAVYGDSDFASNGVMGIPGNRDLFLNTVNWLAQQEDLIAIRPREADDRRVTLTADQQRLTFYTTVLLIPGVIIAAGVYTWWRRRS